jgi:hypothetical protein
LILVLKIKLSYNEVIPFVGPIPRQMEKKISTQRLAQNDHITCFYDGQILEKTQMSRNIIRDKQITEYSYNKNTNQQLKETIYMQQHG